MVLKKLLSKRKKSKKIQEALNADAATPAESHAASEEEESDGGDSKGSGLDSPSENAAEEPVAKRTRGRAFSIERQGSSGGGLTIERSPKVARDEAPARSFWTSSPKAAREEAPAKSSFWSGGGVSEAPARPHSPGFVADLEEAISGEVEPPAAPIERRKSAANFEEAMLGPAPAGGVAPIERRRSDADLEKAALQPRGHAIEPAQIYRSSTRGSNGQVEYQSLGKPLQRGPEEKKGRTPSQDDEKVAQMAELSEAMTVMDRERKRLARENRDLKEDNSRLKEKSSAEKQGNMLLVKENDDLKLEVEVLVNSKLKLEDRVRALEQGKQSESDIEKQNRELRDREAQLEEAKQRAEARAKEFEKQATKKNEEARELKLELQVAEESKRLVDIQLQQLKDTQSDFQAENIKLKRQIQALEESQRLHVAEMEAMVETKTLLEDRVQKLESKKTSSALITRSPKARGTSSGSPRGGGRNKANPGGRARPWEAPDMFKERRRTPSPRRTQSVQRKPGPRDIGRVTHHAKASWEERMLDEMRTVAKPWGGNVNDQVFAPRMSTSPKKHTGGIVERKPGPREIGWSDYQTVSYENAKPQQSDKWTPWGGNMMENTFPERNSTIKRTMHESSSPRDPVEPKAGPRDIRPAEDFVPYRAPGEKQESAPRPWGNLYDADFLAPRAASSLRRDSDDVLRDGRVPKKAGPRETTPAHDFVPYGNPEELNRGPSGLGWGNPNSLTFKDRPTSTIARSGNKGDLPVETKHGPRQSGFFKGAADTNWKPFTANPKKEEKQEKSKPQSSPRKTTTVSLADKKPMLRQKTETRKPKPGRMVKPISRRTGFWKTLTAKSL